MIPAGERGRFRMYEPPMSRRDLALEAGYDPQLGDGEQPALTAAEYDALPTDHPTKVRTARWAHQGSPTGCADCGVRCEDCRDRMCATWGPEPQAGCGGLCVECRPCPCFLCAEARQDAQMEADAQASRDAS